ncbi:MAG: DUF362 domain-containing protein [Oscillospiraceae bacterium]
MDKSKVYFADLEPHGRSLLIKLHGLMKAAGFESMELDGKFVAIKMHFGEPGNLAYLRPNWAAVVCDYVKELGGKPFLTDCNTLYVGGRKNALDHLDSAYKNGFNPFQTGVQTIIADGLKGTDEAYVPVPGGEYVKQAKIGRALADADVVISLTHFKGHESAGFGGALKNLGMGGGSRAGKMEMHSSGKPYVRQKRCVGCGACINICAHGAPVVTDGKCSIDHAKCVGCGRCIGICPKDAIAAANDEANEILNCKIAEYALAVCAGKPSFHVSIVIDVSPCCDCHGENEPAIVPNVGMFASFDPIALDQACVDAVNAQPAMAGGRLAHCEHSHHDHFTDIFPDTDWKAGLKHGEKLGLGSRNYELITL